MVVPWYFDGDELHVSAQVDCDQSEVNEDSSGEVGNARAVERIPRPLVTAFSFDRLV